MTFMVRSTILISLMAWSLFGCGQSGENARVESSSYDFLLRSLLNHNVPEISVANLADSFHHFTILDSREKEEYEVSHIQNAIWVGYDDFDRDRLAQVSKDAPIVVYCSIGYRSEQITDQLAYLGYTNVHNLYGGIFEWVNQGNPVYDQSGETEKVHAYSKTWGIWLNEGEKVYN
jgi:rhodanese-related sulfurtransferase